MIFFQKIQQQCQTYWLGLKPGQRRIMGSASALLLIILAYFLVIAPWISLQHKLDKTLPHLRTDLAKMQHLAEQSRALPATARATAEASQLLPDLQREFTQTNPSLPPPVIRDDGQGRLQLSLGQADFDATLARIATIQNKYPLRLGSAKFTKREATPDQVQVEIVFERPAAQ